MAMFSPKKKLKVGALLGLMFTWGILHKCSSESKHGPETQGVIKTKQLLTNYMKWPQNAKEIPHLRFLKTLWAPHVVQLSVNFWYLGLLVLGANLVLGSMLVGNHWSKVAPKLENSLLIFFSLALASQPLHNQKQLKRRLFAGMWTTTVPSLWKSSSLKSLQILGRSSRITSTLPWAKWKRSWWLIDTQELKYLFRRLF